MMTVQPAQGTLLMFHTVWGGSVANTALILQISVCDYDLILVLKQPLHGSDLQTGNTF